MILSSTKNQATDLGATLAVLLLRLWLGVRAWQTGLEKFAGKRSGSEAVLIDGQRNEYGLTDATSEKFYALGNYHGVPAALADKFKAEPLLPGVLLTAFDWMIGPLLLLTGLTLLLGVATRCSLFVMGLLYVGLTFGLILINENSGVAWLAIHVVLIALMLLNARANRFEITGRWEI